MDRNPKKGNDIKSSIDEKVASLVDMLAQAEVRDSNLIGNRTNIRLSGSNSSGEPPIQSQNVRIKEGKSLPGTPMYLEAEIRMLRSEREGDIETIKKLRDVVSKLEKERQEITEQHDKDIERVRSEEKDKWEGLGARQKSIIDGLLKDKKEMTEKLEEMMIQMESSKTEHQQLVEKLKQAFVERMKKEKDDMMSLEKARRAQWMDRVKKDLEKKSDARIEPKIREIISRSEAQVKDTEERADREIEKMKRDLRKQLETETDRLQEESRAKLNAEITRLETTKDDTVSRMKVLFEQQLEEARLKLRNKELALDNEVEERMLKERQRMEQKKQEEIQCVQRVCDDKILQAQKELMLAQQEAKLAKNHSETVERGFEEKYKMMYEKDTEVFKTKFVNEAKVEWLSQLENIKEKLLSQRDSLIKEAALIVKKESDSKIKTLKEMYKTKITLMKNNIEDINKNTASTVKENEKDKEELKDNIRKLKSQLEDCIKNKEQNEKYSTSLERILKEVSMMSNEDKISHIIRFNALNFVYNKYKDTVESSNEEKLQQMKREHVEELERLTEKVKLTIETKDTIITRLMNDLRQAEAELTAFRKVGLD